MQNDAPIWNDTYTGPRWRYGMTHRPLSYGAQPRGFIVQSDRIDRRFDYGTIDYPRELTADEIAGYELTPVGQVPDNLIYLR